ncbi:NRDE family protein [Hydrogenophaga sp.]|uniref:NRDE family protein n=1 Tax=Hydrogenophaga sp. TaxID=1904254 RepID=UPI003D0DC138
MCLIAFALHTDPACPLLIAANRDEFLDRPTAALHRWALPDGTEIVAGRDLRDGGTWLGLSPGGRVAMLTNVRQSQAGPGARSRGELVTRWLQGGDDVDGLAETIDPGAYGGFNLVVGDFHRASWSWLSNRDPQHPHEQRTPKLHRQALGAGLYGLSNASLDTPWPKTVRLKQALGESLARLQSPEDGIWMHPLAAHLTEAAPAAPGDLPQTGVPPDMERALSSPFVRMSDRAYGTRSSLVVRALPRAQAWDVQMDEWTHDHKAPLARLDAARHRRETLIW